MSTSQNLYCCISLLSPPSQLTMRHVTCEDLLSSTPLVNANHRNTNGPRGIADAQLQVAIIRMSILSLLHKVYDFSNAHQDVWWERTIAEGLEEGFEVLGGLHLDGRGRLPCCCHLHFDCRECKRDEQERSARSWQSGSVVTRTYWVDPRGSFPIPRASLSAYSR